MKKYLFLFVLITLTFSRLSAQEDVEGSKDPALFTRMPNFHIYRYDDLQFDKVDFPVSSEKKQPVEGHYLFIIYWLNDNAQAPSPLQVVRNYTNAATKIGGQLVYQYDDGDAQIVVLKVVKSGKEVWASVSASSNGTYSVTIIEKQAMNQDVVADASSMMNTIRETGKVALYGIYFDTGLSVLKAESQPTLQEIAKLLNVNPALKIYVVGHTDNTGGFESNLKLSVDRANAVVNSLVNQFSVSAARLKACGDGPTAPVATNETEEGRALNRRVELVRQ